MSQTDRCPLSQLNGVPSQPLQIKPDPDSQPASSQSAADVVSGAATFARAKARRSSILRPPPSDLTCPGGSQNGEQRGDENRRKSRRISFANMVQAQELYHDGTIFIRDELMKEIEESIRSSLSTANSSSHSGEGAAMASRAMNTSFFNHEDLEDTEDDNQQQEMSLTPVKEGGDLIKWCDSIVANNDQENDNNVNTETPTPTPENQGTFIFGSQDDNGQMCVTQPLTQQPLSQPPAGSRPKISPRREILSQIPIDQSEFMEQSDDEQQQSDLCMDNDMELTNLGGQILLNDSYASCVTTASQRTTAPSQHQTQQYTDDNMDITDLSLSINASEVSALIHAVSDEEDKDEEPAQEKVEERVEEIAEEMIEEAKEQVEQKPDDEVKGQQEAVDDLVFESVQPVPVVSQHQQTQQFTDEDMDTTNNNHTASINVSKRRSSVSGARDVKEAVEVMQEVEQEAEHETEQDKVSEVAEQVQEEEQAKDKVDEKAEEEIEEEGATEKVEDVLQEEVEEELPSTASEDSVIENQHQTSHHHYMDITTTERTLFMNASSKGSALTLPSNSVEDDEDKDSSTQSDPFSALQQEDDWADESDELDDALLKPSCHEWTIIMDRSFGTAPSSKKNFNLNNSLWILADELEHELESAPKYVVRDSNCMEQMAKFDLLTSLRRFTSSVPANSALQLIETTEQRLIVQLFNASIELEIVFGGPVAPKDIPLCLYPVKKISALNSKLLSTDSWRRVYKTEAEYRMVQLTNIVLRDWCELNKDALLDRFCHTDHLDLLLAELRDVTYRASALLGQLAIAARTWLHDSRAVSGNKRSLFGVKLHSYTTSPVLVCFELSLDTPLAKIRPRFVFDTKSKNRMRKESARAMRQQVKDYISRVSSSSSVDEFQILQCIQRAERFIRNMDAQLLGL